MFVSYEYVKEVDSIISVNFLGNDAKLVSIDKEDRDKGFCLVKDTNYDIDIQLRKMYIEECKKTILWNIYEVSRGLNLDVKEIEDNIINKYDADDFSRLMFKLKKMKVDLSSNKNMPDDVKKEMDKNTDGLVGFKIDVVDSGNSNGCVRHRNFIRKYDSITGELVDTYYSITEAVEKNVGYTKAGISQCINGKRKSYKGFIWKKD